MRILTVEIDQERDFRLLQALLARLGLRWRISTRPTLSQEERQRHQEIIAAGVPDAPGRLEERLGALEEDREDRKLPFRDHETD